MRLINADALRNTFDAMHAIPGGSHLDHLVLLGIKKYIDDSPTIDAVPVVHAKNVTPTHYSDEFLCGNCGFCCEITKIRHDDEDDFGLGGASVYEYECKFCPDCGAKIDGGTEE